LAPSAADYRKCRCWNWGFLLNMQRKEGVLYFSFREEQFSKWVTDGNRYEVLYVNTTVLSWNVGLMTCLFRKNNSIGT
jgi:hypothetical protein